MMQRSIVFAIISNAALISRTGGVAAEYSGASVKKSSARHSGFTLRNRLARY